MTQTAPIDSLQRRYFEDYEEGAVYEFGTATVTETAVIDFAREFDPQSFHIDPEAAQHSSFGGLIASGWHTASIAMRLLVDHFLPVNSSLGSPGVDELRWPAPVCPGDELSMRVTIVETRRSRTKPDRGFMRTYIELVNQGGEVVMTMRAMHLIRRAPRPGTGS